MRRGVGGAAGADVCRGCCCGHAAQNRLLLLTRNAMSGSTTLDLAGGSDHGVCPVGIGSVCLPWKVKEQCGLQVE
jgi:hypothetical protein